jgi:hypothetical protein
MNDGAIESIRYSLKINLPSMNDGAIESIRVVIIQKKSPILFRNIGLHKKLANNDLSYNRNFT